MRDIAHRPRCFRRGLLQRGEVPAILSASFHARRRNDPLATNALACGSSDASATSVVALPISIPAINGMLTSAASFTQLMPLLIHFRRLPDKGGIHCRMPVCSSSSAIASSSACEERNGRSAL